MQIQGNLDFLKPQLLKSLNNGFHWSDAEIIKRGRDLLIVLIWIKRWSLPVKLQIIKALHVNMTHFLLNKFILDLSSDRSLSSAMFTVFLSCTVLYSQYLISDALRSGIYQELLVISYFRRFFPAIGFFPNLNDNVSDWFSARLFT